MIASSRSLYLYLIPLLNPYHHLSTPHSAFCYLPETLYCYVSAYAAVAHTRCMVGNGRDTFTFESRLFKLGRHFKVEVLI